jgi:poly(3-hydroxybutyrate) depolymerase
MLYQAYEWRRSVLERAGRGLSIPARIVTSPLVAAAPHPVLRVSGLVSQMSGVLKLTHVRPEFAITSVDTPSGPVAIEERTVASTPFGNLIHFEKNRVRGRKAAQPKVLVVPGLAGHFATLVKPTIISMLADHDVYVADWNNARDVPVTAGEFGLDEYIDLVITFLREIGPGAHVLSVCQPAVACLAAASVMAEDGDPAAPASLILLAGPVDTRVNPGRINRFAQRQSMTILERTMLHTVPRPLRGAGRRVYPGFVQISGFLGMDPRRHVRALTGLYDDLRTGEHERAARTKAFYEEYFAVLDVPAEFYLQTVERVFLDNDLPRGQFEWRGRRIDPSAIDSALFTIEGQLDEMCRPGQTEAAHALCTGIPPERHKHLLQEGVGHYGVFAGAAFEHEIYPQIREFVDDVSVSS